MEIVKNLIIDIDEEKEEIDKNEESLEEEILKKENEGMKQRGYRGPLSTIQLIHFYFCTLLMKKSVNHLPIPSQMNSNFRN